MNKLSETEIIKIISDDIIGYQVGHEEYEEAVKGLLDLYKQEKEKNKRYLKYLENKDKHYESVLEYMESEKEHDYIAKNKIRDLIKELKKQDKEIRFSKNYLVIPVLELLLQEEG